MGAVYIFINAQAQRVKVGMTINDIDGRLGDVNDMWLKRKVTCQICGGHLVSNRGRVPKHVSNFGEYRECPGGNALPLEQDVVLAESHIEKLKSQHGKLSGSEKGSVTRMINTLEKRVENYRHLEWATGRWRHSTVFYTECAWEVESLTHEILAERLDKTATFGEVFCCSVSEATEAVETALGRLGLLETARKEVRNDNTSKEYGNCIICGGNLTEKGSCPECVQRFLP